MTTPFTLVVAYHLKPITVEFQVVEELKENFRSLDKNRSHRFLRDEILSKAILGFCPYCNARKADSLDHVLPRSVYPEFAVLAQNLVPSCDTCNRKKGQMCYRYNGKNIAHPYYVSIPTDPILFADVVMDTTAVWLNFWLQQNREMEDTDFESLSNLFNELELPELYQTISIGELSDRWEQMDSVSKMGGPDELRGYLHREANGSRRSRGENYWKTALLSAVSKSDEFCETGYKLLGPKFNQ